MFLRCASLGVLLVLGAALASCIPINFMSDALTESYNTLKDHLKLTEPVVGSNPIITPVIGRMNNSCQEEVVMSATLDVYMKIFSTLLKHNSCSQQQEENQMPSAEQDPIQKPLQVLCQEMNQLKTRLADLQQNKEDLLSKINTIKVDDRLVQRKALAEFKEVYGRASYLLHQKTGH